MRILHTCDTYEMGKKYGSTALSVTADIHADPNNRWTYVLGLAYACCDTILLIFCFSVVY